MRLEKQNHSLALALHTGIHEGREGPRPPWLDRVADPALGWGCPGWTPRRGGRDRLLWTLNVPRRCFAILSGVV